MLTSVCGIRLSTFGVCIGWIGGIYSFLAVILTSVSLGEADEIAQQIVKEYAKLTVDQVRIVLVIVLSIYLSLQLINLLASGMLIVGTLKERHLYLVPWLFNNFVTLVFGIITQVGLWVEASSGLLPSILISVLCYIISLYVYYAVYSLFKQIQRNSDQQRPLIPPQSSGRNYEGLPINQ